MISTYLFPEDRRDAEKALEDAAQAAIAIRNVHSVGWIINYHYLNGIRSFPLINYRDGRVQIRYSNQKGQQGFRYEEALVRFTNELGRLSRMDIAPSVKLLGMSLDGVRKRSVAQIVLSSLYNPSYLDTVKIPFLRVLLAFGTAGIAGWRVEGPDGYPRYPLEVIPPWELLPFPADPVVPADEKGLIRTRWVPIEWLKTHKDVWKRIDRSRHNEIKVIRVTYGNVTTREAGPQAGASSNYRFSAEIREGLSDAMLKRDGTGGGKDMRTQEFVNLRELWLYNELGKVSQYVVTVGGVCAINDKFEGHDAYPPPIGIARYHHVGGFWGRSFVGPLIPIVDETEKMLANLFTNIQDLDLFGLVLVPTTSGINLNALNARRRPRAMPYEPDVAAPQHKPFNLTPANTGTLPGEVAKMGMDVVERLSGQTQMLQGEAPGRVDSARALGLLMETSSIPLGGPAATVAAAFSLVYASVLYDARKRMDAKGVVKYTFLDDTLAGVVLDPDGNISLAENAIPDPDEIEISIASRYPQSSEQRKEELFLLLKAGLISPRQFRIQARILGLDLPVSNDAEWENYRQAVLNNIRLFNDGETPGEVVIGEHENHEIHLERIDAFMARPEYRLASAAVREAFEKLREERRVRMGVYPDQLPYPEEMAMEETQGGPPSPAAMAAQAVQPSQAQQVPIE